jgi:FixJ family two-component response regulator
VLVDADSSGGQLHHPGEGGPTKVPMRTVLIVTTDIATRDSLCAPLAIASFATVPIDAESVLLAPRSPAASCAVVSLTGPDDGTSLRAIRELDHARIAVIAIGAPGCAETILAAMRNGARDYLARPLQPKRLLDAIVEQLDRPVPHSAHGASHRHEGFDRLSRRECEVLDLVVRGHSTKQIAAQLGRVEKTVEYHRKRIMEKLGAINVAQVVRLTTLCDWRPPQSAPAQDLETAPSSRGHS